MTEPLLSIRLEPGNLDNYLGRALINSESASRKLITKILVRALGEVQEKTEVGSTGFLRGGYMIEGPRAFGKGRTRGALVNGILYHDIVERGRKPGRMPPPRALEKWVGSKLGVAPDDRAAVAFLVARKIGRVGFPGHHMVAEGWAKARRRIRPELRKAGLKIVRG